MEKDLRECLLCEHRCGVDRLSGKSSGVCHMGGPVTASRTLHPAPPESYTIFLAGCNFKCLHCQNWNISQFPDNNALIDGYLDPDSLASESITQMESYYGRSMGADRIFFSGGEPTIHLPYIEKIMESARKLKPSCLVNFDTNGFMTENSLARILTIADSITFDLKAYNDETHMALTGAPVSSVLRNAEIIARKAPEKIWEFRIVVIPNINEEDIAPICGFLARISLDLPVCFLAFRPNFVLEGLPGASRELMKQCLETAQAAGLKNVSTAGLTDIHGWIPDEYYSKKNVDLAASFAASQGCRSNPRDCRTCQYRTECLIKRYIPGRSC